MTSLSRQLRGTIHLVNLGVPGITLARAATQELPIAVDARPDMVVMWLAVNDFAANVPLATYSSQLRSAIHTLRTQTSARVYIANLPDLTAIPYLARGDQQALAARVADWNDAIAAACAREGATPVNLFSDWQEYARIQNTSVATGCIPRRSARSDSPRFSVNPSSHANHSSSRQGYSSP